MKTIEYIGAAPKKPKKANPIGGWFLIIFALGLGAVFLRPLLPFLEAQQGLTSETNLEETVGQLEKEGNFGSALAIAALRRTQANVTYDKAYYKIDYPNGDIPADKGACADVIIRAYRALDIDLQELVHNDMRSDYRAYPQNWADQRAPDSNIDHRRVENLQRFFERQNAEKKVTRNSDDYEFGDLVCWRLTNGGRHIGIVVPGPASKKTEKWVVHNVGTGPIWEDALLSYDVIGHYRYGRKKKAVKAKSEVPVEASGAAASE